MQKKLYLTLKFQFIETEKKHERDAQIFLTNSFWALVSSLLKRNNIDCFVNENVGMFHLINLKNLFFQT